MPDSSGVMSVPELQERSEVCSAALPELNRRSPDARAAYSHLGKKMGILVLIEEPREKFLCARDKIN